MVESVNGSLGALIRRRPLKYWGSTRAENCILSRGSGVNGAYLSASADALAKRRV